VLRGLWMRISSRRREKAAGRAEEYEQMSRDERRFVNESVDDRAARIDSDARLGAYEAEARGEDHAP
jgi:hypothetical protein